MFLLSTLVALAVPQARADATPSSAGDAPRSAVGDATRSAAGDAPQRDLVSRASDGGVLVLATGDVRGWTEPCG